MTSDAGPCFYCPELPGVGNRASLEEEETHHASAARRIRVGDVIGLIDGEGVRADAVVESVARRRLTFTVRARRRVPRPEPAIVVASAVPKGERFRALIDMLSQIGAAGILPLHCERSAVKPRQSAGLRWRRVAIEACKQSRNPWVPEIESPRTVADSLECVEEGAALVFADVDGRTAREVLPAAGRLFLYVGPEGGFTEAEKELLKGRGAQALCLGDNVLRVETAALVAAVQCLSAGHPGDG